MKTFGSLAAVALGAAVGLLSGCGSTAVNSVEPAQSSAQRAMLSDKCVFNDRSLAKAVRVLGINTATDQGGFLKIQIEVQNTTRSRKLFTYRIEWFDEHGILISLPTTVATPRSLEGRDLADITATAPTAKAKDFRIQFLEPVS